MTPPQPGQQLRDSARLVLALGPYKGRAKNSRQLLRADWRTAAWHQDLGDVTKTNFIRKRISFNTDLFEIHIFLCIHAESVMFVVFNDDLENNLYSRETVNRILNL